jgi:hypothetical protein
MNMGGGVDNDEQEEEVEHWMNLGKNMEVGLPQCFVQSWEE